MIRKNKFFISVLAEKRWLEQMNKLGFEPTGAYPGGYTFEKTDRRFNFEYVFLKHGRKSFKKFDYKSKDERARAVYANSDRALFKRLEEAGEFTLFSSRDEKILNAERKKTQLNTQAILNMGLVLVATLLSEIIYPVSWFFRLCAIVFAILAAIDYTQTYQLMKYIKSIK